MKWEVKAASLGVNSIKANVHFVQPSFKPIEWILHKFGDDMFMILKEVKLKWQKTKL